MFDTKKLAEVNKLMKYTDVKGKMYAEVNQRISAFRELEPNGSIETEILSIENGTVVIKATIKNSEGAIIATGHAYEKEGSSFINKTSYIENCETSAVGRALGMVGLGIKDAIASASEVSQAREQQKTSKNVRSELVKLCTVEQIDIKEIAKKFNLTNDSPDKDYEKALEYVIEQTAAFPPLA